MKNLVAKTDWLIYVHNQWSREDRDLTLFLKQPDLILNDSQDFWDVLVLIGSFRSRTQAKKNNFKQDIPDGLFLTKVGLRKITIFKPHKLWFYFENYDFDKNELRLKAGLNLSEIVTIANLIWGQNNNLMEQN